MWKKIAFVIFAMLLLIPSTIVSADSIQPIQPPEGIISWWTGDGTAADFINTNNGMLLNGTAFSTGQVGQCFSFDGINDSVKINTSSSLNLANAHTIDLWVNLTNLPSSNYLLMNKWASGLENKLLDIRNDGVILYYLHNVVGGSSLESNTKLVPNTWYHIAATYDGSTAKIYINGQLDASKAASGDVADHSGSLYFGYNPDRAYEGWFVPFKGKMDEIEWFNRALSLSEIQSIYNAGSAGKVKIWSLPRQYSGTQGLYNWYYYASTTLPNITQLTFDNYVLPWGTRPFNDWNNSNSRYMEFVGRDSSNWQNIGSDGASGWLQPGEYGYNNFAIGWKAPKSGTVYISGMVNTASPDPTSLSGNDDGVLFSIYKGTTSLSGPALVFRGNNEANRVESATLTPTTSVATGDMIYFYINRRNWQDADAMYYSFTVSYDSTADRTAPVSNHSFVPNQLTLSASDAGSGVAGIEYIQYYPAWTTWTQYTGPITRSPGVAKFMYRALDNNGNIEAYHRATVVFKNPPSADGGGPYNGTEGSPVTFSGSGTDLDGDILTYYWNFGDGGTASGSLTPTHAYADNGSYTVTLTVTDIDGMSDTDTATVTIFNTTPVVNAGADATINEGSIFTSSGSFNDPGVDTWTATVDYDDGYGEQPLSLNPDKTFILENIYPVGGTYTITVTVTDDDGGIGIDNLNITVIDITPPVITLLGDNFQTIEYGDSYVELGATAWDICDGDLTADIVIDASAVDTIVVGSYAVTYNVTDTSGNAAVQVTRTVNVVDTTPPVITLLGDNPLTIECGDAYTELGATAWDICCGDITANIVIDASAVNTAMVGSYTATYDVTDTSGNAAVQVTRTVNVVDTTSPILGISISPDVLWPANHEMVEVTVTITVSDIGDSSPTVVLTSIKSNEPDDAKGNGDGNTVDDIQSADIGSEDYQFLLRAERAGNGNGRTYTITYTVTDASGNSTTVSILVIVPHDKGKK